MLTDVASSLSQGPSRNATKQLRSLEKRATSQLQEKHSYSQHTRSICYQVPIIIVAVYHRIARPSYCALSNDERHAAPSASPMAVATPPIYESGKLSNVASSLSHRPSRSATKKLRPLKLRATPRLPERSHNIYFAQNPGVGERNALECRVIIVTAPAAERYQATALSRRINGTQPH